jgi:hypothetical protein
VFSAQIANIECIREEPVCASLSVCFISDIMEQILIKCLNGGNTLNVVK